MIRRPPRSTHTQSRRQRQMCIRDRSIALYSEFDTLDDVKYYATHPDHVAAGKLIAAVKESRACVDYEIIEN